MQFFEVVKSRHSIRAFKPIDVDDERLELILSTANLAPSAGNLQAYEIVLVRDPQRRSALARAAYGQDFVAQAPVALVFCANPMLSAAKYGRRGAELYSIQDATIAAAYAQLAATALGLASVWVGAFDPEAVGRAINAPQGVLPIAIISIGYPAEQPMRTRRRDLRDIVKHETF